LDDGCPAEEAAELAEQVRGLYLRSPVAIVFAHREYEAWFLASMEVIARNNADRFPANLSHLHLSFRAKLKKWDIFSVLTRNPLPNLQFGRFSS